MQAPPFQLQRLAIDVGLASVAVDVGQLGTLATAVSVQLADMLCLLVPPASGSWVEAQCRALPSQSQDPLVIAATERLFGLLSAVDAAGSSLQLQARRWQLQTASSQSMAAGGQQQQQQAEPVTVNAYDCLQSLLTWMRRPRIKLCKPFFSKPLAFLGGDSLCTFELCRA